MDRPMMPKATAVWLVENTALTFKQIAEFCGLHELEIQAVADNDSGVVMTGLDPVGNHQLTLEEIKRCEADPNAKLVMLKQDIPLPPSRSKGARYTPISKRQDKPDAIAWIVRHHPELSDAQISKLLGTTKSTIAAVRDRSHWNATNIRPRDPREIGLCSYPELEAAVARAKKRQGIQQPAATPAASEPPQA